MILVLNEFDGHFLIQFTQRNNYYGLNATWYRFVNQHVHSRSREESRRCCFILSIVEGLLLLCRVNISLPIVDNNIDRNNTRQNHNCHWFSQPECSLTVLGIFMDKLGIWINI